MPHCKYHRSATQLLSHCIASQDLLFDLEACQSPQAAEDFRGEVYFSSLLFSSSRGLVAVYYSHMERLSWTLDKTIPVYVAILMLLLTNRIIRSNYEQSAIISFVIMLVPLVCLFVWAVVVHDCDGRSMAGIICVWYTAAAQ